MLIVAPVSVPKFLRAAPPPGLKVRQTMQLRMWFTVVVRLVRTPSATLSPVLLLVYRSLSSMWAAARIPKCPLMIGARALLQSDPRVFLVMILVLEPLAKITQLPLRKSRGLSGESVVTASALPVCPATMAVILPGSSIPSALSVTTTALP